MKINKDFLVDYRENIVFETNKCECKRKDTNNLCDRWNELNILEQTIKYELGKKYKHVEKYESVKNISFCKYCRDYKNEYRTADIMNGWWYCFRELLGIKNRKSVECKNSLCVLLKECKDFNRQGNINEMLVDLLKNHLNIKYKNNFNEDEQKDICRALLRLLKVVYTDGNITPAPLNPVCTFETCQYKLEKYKDSYNDHNGDIEKLYFQDYCEDGKIKINPTTKEFKENPSEIMNERVRLIIRRGYRISNHGKEILEDDLKQIFDELL